MTKASFDCGEIVEVFREHGLSSAEAGQPMLHDVLKRFMGFLLELRTNRAGVDQSFAMILPVETKMLPEFCCSQLVEKPYVPLSERKIGKLLPVTANNLCFRRIIHERHLFCPRFQRHAMARPIGALKPVVR